MFFVKSHFGHIWFKTIGIIHRNNIMDKCQVNPTFEHVSNVEPLQYGLRSEEVPPWLRFPHLTTNYRFGGTYWTCLLSLFAWHSETVNTWTMLLANIFSLTALVYVMVVEKPTGIAKLPFYMFWFSAIVHMPFSVGYHMFMPISAVVYNKWRRLDISFIFVASCPLTFALCYFIMPLAATLSVTGAAITVTTLALFRNFSLKQGEVLNRSTNAIFITSIVIVYFSPIVYLSVVDTIAGKFTVAQITLIVVFLSLFIGGYMYAKCIPECYSHGTFDLVGRSHQIMHILVMTAHVSEFFFVYDAFKRFSN